MRIKWARVMWFASLALVVVSLSAAYAGLAKVGPVDPVSGYPQWYMDENGVALEICTGQPARCASTPVDPNNPASVNAGFGDEAFYWLADASGAIPVGPNGETCRQMTLALEAAWGGAGTPREGAQIVFSRIRVRCTNLTQPGRYTVMTPFQTRRVNAVPDPVNPNLFRINVTADAISNASTGFSAPLTAGSVGPFLKQLSPPTGFIGNGGVLSRVTGGTNGNVFQLLDPNGALITTARRFAVVGRLATNGGLQNVRATYSRTAAEDGTIDLTADSIGGQRLIAFGAAATGVGLRPVAGELGAYARSIPFNNTAVLPFSVTVVNRTDASRPRVTVAATDVVAITRAVYTLSTQTLVVRASSSDLSVADPTRLEVFDPSTALRIGRINRFGVFRILTPITPARVNVVSNKGGRDLVRVEIVP